MKGEAVGAQGVPLTAGRSIAVDNSLHVYGTPFFIQTGPPLANETRRRKRSSMSSSLAQSRSNLIRPMYRRPVTR